MIERLASYKNTTVPWGRTQADLMKMLNQREISDIQFTNIGYETALQNGLEMKKDTYAISLLFQKKQKMPDGTAGNIPVRILIPNIPVSDNRSLNQSYRLLYWYLKSKFEAIDTGLVEFAEEFMPHLQIVSQTGGVARLWDTFKRGFYQAISSGQQGNINLLPPMNKEGRGDD